MKKVTFKPVILVAFVLTISLTVSCENDLLDTKPGQPTERNFFATENAYEQAVIGMYASLTRFYEYYSGGFPKWLEEVRVLPSDALTVPQNRALEDFSVRPSTNHLSAYYKSLYLLINRTNIVLQKLKTADDDVFTTPGLKKKNRGEALFLRSFANFRLWNIFGTAPLDTTRVESLDDVNSPNSKGTELLDQAIKDLKTATQLLPESWEDKYLGRATKNAAYGFLGKVLVFRATVNHSQEDYQAAIQAFNKIKGVHLVANFEDNFNYQTENNTESLFEFQAGTAFTNDNPYLHNNGANSTISDAAAYWGFFDKSNYARYGEPVFLATQKLVNSFTPGDSRLPLTVDTTNFNIQKYVLNDKIVGFNLASVNNPRILRYADVLLLTAEAVLQSGGSTAKAIGLINQVRTRARNMGNTGAPQNLNTSETDKKTIMQWIQDERLRELAGEGHRWFDLRRWALGDMIQLNNSFFDSDIPDKMQFTKNNLNFPFPLNATDKNANLKQNPGY